MKKTLFYTMILAVCIGTSASFTSCKKKSGCTNKDAFNYDADAHNDDGSCIAPEEIQKALIIGFPGG